MSSRQSGRFAFVVAICYFRVPFLQVLLSFSWLSWYSCFSLSFLSWNWIYGWDRKTAILYSISRGNFPFSLPSILRSRILLLIMISFLIYSSSSVSYDFFPGHRIPILSWLLLLYFTPITVIRMMIPDVKIWSVHKLTILSETSRLWKKLKCLIRWFRIRQFQCWNNKSCLNHLTADFAFVSKGSGLGDSLSTRVFLGIHIRVFLRSLVSSSALLCSSFQADLFCWMDDATIKTSQSDLLSLLYFRVIQPASLFVYPKTMLHFFVILSA